MEVEREPRLVTHATPPLSSSPVRFISFPLHKDESASRFMSDIRLHTFRNSRTRNGYARHDSSRQQPSAASSASANLAFGSHAGSPMPTTVAAAAAASSSSLSSSRRNKGRRRNDYGEGEPEEEATLLGEGERDPGFLHDDGEEEEEERGGIPTRVERVHDAASQVSVRVVEWSSGSPHELATSAIDAAEGIKGQISYCAFTTTRCVDRCIHIKRLLISTSGKTSCRASLLLTSFAIRSTMYSPFYPSSFTSSSSSSSTSISSSLRCPNSFPPSEPVRFHFLRTIAGSSRSESLFLPTSLHRFPYNIHCPTLFRSPCHDG